MRQWMYYIDLRAPASHIDASIYATEDATDWSSTHGDCDDSHEHREYTMSEEECAGMYREVARLEAGDI